MSSIDRYQQLLNFDAPFDVSLFDAAVEEFFIQGNMQVQQYLVQLQEHSAAWTRVDAIMEGSKSSQSRILALNILEKTVQYKWHALPQDQQMGIRTYIVNLIIKLSSDSTSLKQNRSTLGKLNLVLVQIVKHSWPTQWPNFIAEIVNASKHSESIATNNMNILLLLSEEVFDYSNMSVTAERAKQMKTSLNADFEMIFHLSSYILSEATDAELLLTTLRTLLRFLQWIPIGYIFETPLIEILVTKFFHVQLFQNATLQCLTEIAILPLRTDDPTESKYFMKILQLFVGVIEQTGKLIQPTTDLQQIYDSGDNTAQNFIRHITLFITGFLKHHGTLVEQQQDDTVRRTHLQSLELLLRLSRITDVVIWKICLEYWNVLLADLFSTQRMYLPNAQANTPNGNALGAAFNLGSPFGKPATSPRLQMYNAVLSELRKVMIVQMAKPEEVLIVEDDNGEIVRESLKDTDAITLYKSMREGLIFLTNLDSTDTQDVMLHKLSKQVDGSEWSWNNLNTLCWAIGSISGALTEQAEKSFLVRVIKDLLGLCEMKRGKDHKAVIASNIMYVVGQYPRFLRQHWKFLKTVVNKLFEFMHESHPGVQDMSVDTFLKIAKKCRKKFTQLQAQEQRPFIEEIIENLPATIADLDAQQIHGFYEACGEIIASEADPARRQHLVFGLMELPNKTWTEIITRAQNDTQSLYDTKVIKQVVFVLRTNNRVAMSIGSGYVVQLARIYVDTLQLYRLYSQYINARIAEAGPQQTKTAVVRGMRSVKKEVLNLIRSFVASSVDVDRSALLNQFLPALLSPGSVLDDYRSSVPDARDAEVLLLLSTLVDRLGSQMSDTIPQVFENTFQVTLQMITHNFSDFPEIRSSFFVLLHSIVQQCFSALCRLDTQHFQLVLDSILWSVKHLERNIAETGLDILHDLVLATSASDIASEFFTHFYIQIVQDILEVLTDTLHKAGFKLQATILAKLFALVAQGQITKPLWHNPKYNPNGQQYSNNQQYIKQITSTMLKKAFPNLTVHQVESFVNGCFVHYADVQAFKVHLRDFLIQLKEFAGEEANQELFAEEQQARLEAERIKQEERVAAVPGLQYQSPQVFNAPREVTHVKQENGQNGHE